MAWVHPTPVGTTWVPRCWRVPLWVPDQPDTKAQSGTATDLLGASPPHRSGARGLLSPRFRVRFPDGPLLKTPAKPPFLVPEAPTHWDSSFGCLAGLGSTCPLGRLFSHFVATPEQSCVAHVACGILAGDV